MLTNFPIGIIIRPYCLCEASNHVWRPGKKSCTHRSLFGFIPLQLLYIWFLGHETSTERLEQPCLHQASSHGLHKEYYALLGYREFERHMRWCANPCWLHYDQLVLDRRSPLDSLSCPSFTHSRSLHFSL